MAPKPVSLTLKQRIEEELATLDVRITELRIALKVVHEFDADDTETATNGAETKRIILKVGDEVPEAVKSRLVERGSHGSEVADETFELERY